MSIIYVLIPIAMLFVLVAVGIFFWAVKSDQFDDLEKQSVSILFEDDKAQSDNASQHNTSSNLSAPLANTTDLKTSSSQAENIQLVETNAAAPQGTESSSVATSAKTDTAQQEATKQKSAKSE
ncbi:cbb3-type cytochrome oxidase assembly protein CcoS [Shewanella sp. 0m-8]